MSQTVVPKFYSTRKRFKNSSKSIDIEPSEKGTEYLPVLEKIVPSTTRKSVAKSEKAVTNKTIKAEFLSISEKTASNNVKSEIPKGPGKTITTSFKKSVQKTKTKYKNVNKITNYLKSESESIEVNKERIVSLEKVENQRTQKRNLSPEELTPSKKKTVSVNSVEFSPTKSSLLLSPVKRDAVTHKRCLVASPSKNGSPRKIVSPQKIQLSPQKVAAYENLSSKDLVSNCNLIFLNLKVFFCFLVIEHMYNVTFGDKGPKWLMRFLD